MRKRLVLHVLLLLLAIGFIACQKDKSNNLDNSVLSFQIQALNKSFALPVTSTGLKSATLASASIELDSARMVVSGVKFEASLKRVKSNRDSIEIEYKWNGPQEIDLFDPALSFGRFNLDPGFYNEIELKVDGFKQDAGVKPVFYLHGFYNKDASTKVPIRLKVNENVAFKTEKNSVEITASDPVFTSIIQVYLDKLLVDVPIAALDNATLTKGVIVISADSNKELYKTIVRNLVKDHHCEHNKGKGKSKGD